MRFSHLAYLILCSSFLFVGCGSKNDLAECLTDKGRSLYAIKGCSHCQHQKMAFGSAISSVSVVECASDPMVCGIAGVNEYPTWVNVNGEKFSGFRELSALAEKVDCPYSGN